MVHYLAYHRIWTARSHLSLSPGPLRGSSPSGCWCSLFCWPSSFSFLPAWYCSGWVRYHRRWLPLSRWVWREMNSCTLTILISRINKEVSLTMTDTEIHAQIDKGWGGWNHLSQTIDHRLYRKNSGTHKSEPQDSEKSWTSSGRILLNVAK